MLPGIIYKAWNIIRVILKGPALDEEENQWGNWIRTRFKVHMEILVKMLRVCVCVCVRACVRACILIAVL